MDTQQFGTFIAGLRKEKGLTQAALAQKLQVTDKAVSRWERGLGFPDINTLEPLASALEISVAELMNTRKNPEPTVTKEDAANAVAVTVQAAEQQHRRLLKKLAVCLGLCAAAVVLLAVLWMVLTGFSPRTDVYLGEYAVLPSGDAAVLHVGVAGPMGYVRSCEDVSATPGEVHLRFYSAFGGLNSRLGAQNVFLLPLEDDCTAVYFEHGNGLRLVLQKNAAGDWEQVPANAGGAP